MRSLIRQILRPGIRSSAILVFAILPLGCSTMKVEPLMPTPLMYQLGEQGPTDHIPDEERWNLRQVFYFTTRERDPDLRKIVYGNEESEEVSIGVSLIGFGGYDLTWSDLRDASMDADRAQDVPLSIAGVMEVGRLDVAEKGEILEVKGASQWLIKEIRQAIDDARDKDVMIYVHGAKVDFYNASAFAAQLDHFMGRDMTSIAFSWPTRQNILAYRAFA